MGPSPNFWQSLLMYAILLNYFRLQHTKFYTRSTPQGGQWLPNIGG